jgi:thioredoxin reductase
MLPIDGFGALWGSAVFQCPYCHGWEVQDRRWGFLSSTPDWSHQALFVLMLRSWSQHVTVFFSEPTDLPQATRAQLEGAGIGIEDAPVKRLIAQGAQLEAVELASGARIACDVLFAHPPQQQVALIRALGVALDEHGFVQIDPMKRETSRPGIYAAGDLATRQQGAIFAAAAGMHAAAMLNMDLAAS